MAAQRTQRFMDVDMAECRPAGAKADKPCWITEWGFPNKDFDCPAHDDGRARLVAEMRANFARVAAKGRLMEVTIFYWNSEPWSKELDADSIYRCGAPTPNARLAIEPIGRD
jgi:hypothetical protein